MTEESIRSATQILGKLLTNTKGTSLIVTMPQEASKEERLRHFEQSMAQYAQVINMNQGEENDSDRIETKNNTKKKNKQRKKRMDELKNRINCIVCQIQKREILFTPCNHVCCCEDCAQKVKDKCIYCKAVIQNKLKVYFP